MKKLCLLLWLSMVALSWSTTIQAQDKRVKSVEFNNFERLPDQNSEEELTLVKKEIKAYDDRGRMAKQEIHLANPIGELVKNKVTTKTWEKEFKTRTVETFDEMGDPILKTTDYVSTKTKKKVKEEFVDYLKAAKEIYTKTYTYNKAGKTDKITLTNKASKKIGEEMFKYNSDNEEVLYKKYEIQPNGNRYTEQKKTSYTKDGFLASSEKVVKDGKDTYKDLITFERNKVKEHLKYKNGEQISAFGGAKATYDPSKAKVLRDFGSGGGSGGSGFGSFAFLVSEDEFDDKGNKIKTIKKEGEEIKEVVTYRYDKNTNLTETKTIFYTEGEETGSTKEVLEYDDQKNVLKKIFYKDGDIMNKEEYVYTYFE